MEKDRQTKIIAIVALFIGVATLSIGFAIFSSQLRIQSKATVTLSEDSFKVVLSKEQNNEVVGNVNPLGKGEEATISNAGNPTISNLKANFVSPGEKVVYEFYAVNTGYMDAYLNKIEYANVKDQTINKVCTGVEGTTASLVEKACESIRVTVKVGEEDTACQTSTYGAHKLAKGFGEKVVVTIEFDKKGVVADGSFNVEFGDIMLNYSAIDAETKNVSACDEFVSRPVYGLEIEDRTNIVDNDNDGKISIKDKVTLGTESFYVISTDEEAGIVTMLSEWNLNVGENTVEGATGMQNEACKGWIDGLSGNDWKCTIAFSSTNYWSSSISTYPTWVYNNQSNLYTHVNTYVDKLKEAGYSTATGRLIKYEELVSLGCEEAEIDGACNSAPTWVRNTTYWSGSAYDSTDVWTMGANGNFVDGGYSNGNRNGVRPVITISASEI